MRVIATYLYPDFTAKKKYSSFESKKSNKNCEKSFEECLANINKQMDELDQRKKRNTMRNTKFYKIV